MRRFFTLSTPALLAAAVLFSGCGGSDSATITTGSTTGTTSGTTGGTQETYTVQPTDTSAVFGEQRTITATNPGTSVTSYVFTVREANGGTITVGSGANANVATYTAPDTAGTYHVDVEFFRGAVVVAKRTVTITVAGTI